MMKLYTKKFASGGFMFISIVSLFSSLFFVFKYLLFDMVKTDFTLAVIPYAIVGGIMYASSSVLVFFAVRIGSLAVTNLILGYTTVINALYGIIVLKDSANIFTYIGIVVMIFALFLLKANEGNSAEAKKSSLTWFILAFVGMLTSAGYSILSKTQQVIFNNTVDSEFAIISIGFSFMATFVVSILMDRKQAAYVLKTCVPYAAPAGICNGGANLLAFIYNPMVPYSIASPTRSLMTKIFHFVMGSCAFKELYTKRQILGLILVCFAVVLINVAKYINI